MLRITLYIQILKQQKVNAGYIDQFDVLAAKDHSTKGTKFLIKEFRIILTMMEGDAYTNERGYKLLDIWELNKERLNKKP